MDTLFFAVLAPLLPQLAHELALSKLSAGLLTASYPIGCLLGSLPSAALVTRIGPRATICSGLAMLVVSTLAFALLRSVVPLDLARAVEGWSGAALWSGGIAWLVADVPQDARGALVGKALGAGIAGTLLGPVIGTIAIATGRSACFCGLAAVEAGLAAWTLTFPERRSGAAPRLFDALAAMRGGDTALGLWLVALPAAGSGVLGVLGPLRLHRFGAAAAVVGLVFLCAGALEAGLAPVVGRLSDVRGRIAPMRVGLLAGAVTTLLFTLPHDVWLLALVILLITTAIGTFWAPALAMLSDSVERRQIDQAVGAALMNLGWAGGQIVGSGGGGAIAKLGGDGLPLAVIAGLCLLTFVGVSRGRGHVVARARSG